MIGKIAQKVARRWVQGGIFEAPPRMLEEMSEWALFAYCSHVLAGLDELIEFYEMMEETSDLREAQAIKKDCLQYAPIHSAKEKRPNTDERRMFAIDLYGWKYRDWDQDFEYQVLLKHRMQEVLVLMVFRKQRFGDVGGSWNPGKRTITVFVPVQKPKTQNELRKQLFEIRKKIRHELQHVGQEVLGWMRGMKEEAGLPPKRMRTKEIPSELLVGDPSDPYKSPFVHPLSDAEFETRLQDEVDEFMRENFHLPSWDLAIHKWINKRIFFITLKNFQRDKYKRAIKKFTQALEQENAVQ